jgi:YD repeat-containing protein
MNRRIAWRAVWALLLTMGPAAASAQTPIQYLYDEVGRLIAVIDPSGDTAVYHYDAVGNVLAIDRHASSAVSIISFAPSTGPVGTSVTISGTGFSTTASLNSVTFNGTAATVTTATTTALVVSVPSGATTGTIGDTSPSGSATSASSFTVSTGTGVPTITSFSPTVGLPGTSVTVSGTNFDAAPIRNRVLFNGLGSTAVSSATSTSLSTAVGVVATSGHLTVATPAGSAISAGDFFVPPVPYVAADVDSTGRGTLGTAANMAVGTATQIGLLVFDATAAHRVSFKIVPGPISTVSVFRPDGAFLTSASVGTFPAFIEPVVMPSTGTYLVSVDPAGTGTGTTTVTAYDVPADVTGTITPTTGGAAATPSLSTPGQNALYTIATPAHSRVSLNIGAGSIGGTVVVRNPDGSTLTSGPLNVFSTFLEPWAFASGQTVTMDPAGADTGTPTVTAYDVPDDLTGTITPDGSNLNATIVAPGQNGLYSLGTPTHARVSLAGSTAPFGTVISVRNPDGSTLTSGTVGIFGGFVEPWTFASGQTIKIDPSGSSTGTVTVAAYDVPDDLTGTITPGGSSVTAALATPGQNGVYTIGTATNARVSLSIPTAPFGTVITVRNADGSTLRTTNIAFAAGFIDPWTFASGQTIKVDPGSSSAGNVTMTAYDVPPDVSGSVTIGGSAVGVTTTVPGQNGSLTFAGTASQQVTVHVTNNAMGTVTVKLLSPTGGLLAIASSFGSSFNLSSATLPATGTYTISVDPWDAGTGGITISVSTP